MKRNYLKGLAKQGLILDRGRGRWEKPAEKRGEEKESASFISSISSSYPNRVTKGSKGNRGNRHASEESRLLEPASGNNGRSDSVSSQEDGGEVASSEAGAGAKVRMTEEEPNEEEKFPESRSVDLWLAAAAKSSAEKHECSAATSFEKNQHVQTPKGWGRVVKVKDSTVIVELDSARIGETEAFNAEDMRPAEEVLREASF